MKNVKEIVETMISFDIFFQRKKFKKSKSIFSYILFVYLFFGCMLILPDDYRFFVLPGKYASNIDDKNLRCILFLFLAYLSYIVSFFSWYECIKKSISLFIIIYFFPMYVIFFLYWNILLNQIIKAHA